jgi:hypothetical protein
MNSSGVVLGLVPRIQRPASAAMDGRDKPDHDNRMGARSFSREVLGC